jgi:hypothetical protein
MKTEEQIEQRLQWLIKALDDEENQQEATQIKLYAQIDLINWIKR